MRVQITPSARILLADDHQLFSDGLCSLLNTEADFQIVGQVYDGTGVRSAVQQYAPDLLLLDVNMPRQNGHDLAPYLLRDFPSLKIIILTMYAEQQLVDDFRRIGVSGYILKNASRPTLLTGIRTVLAGGHYFDPQLTKNVAPNGHADDVFLKQYQLTPRELTIIRLVVEGLNSQQIAAQTGLSYLTIKTHRRNIHFKLGTNSTAELIRLANEQGL
ncbi:response regulator transcription factor [Fibrella sp. HMF5036]|uniref:Response regulator transcription factor n=2 Tax=Fibrella aquatilis TaxID=2817059 RepID=A0A939GA54_9BACT|nr:response regulator transcription factor [Fibrella aquatilis]